MRTSEFKEYRRKKIFEMRPVTNEDIVMFEMFEELTTSVFSKVLISEYDIKNGSPKIGDMIVRDQGIQWLIPEEYFKNKFEEIN